METAYTSISSLFFKSGLFVKTILFILAVFSVISWGIAINRWKKFKKSEQENNKFLKMIKDGVRFSKVYVESKVMYNSPLASMFASVFSALERGTLIKEYRYKGEMGDVKIGKRFNTKMVERLIESESVKGLSELEKSIPFLGTVATISPFLGLLGTVWGVMRSFLDIGIHGSANIMVVAPGIAEALITTVVGIAVAIPAVFFHNHFVGKLKKTSVKLEDFASELIGLFEEGKLSDKI